jgi:hypothetical protein
VLFAIKTHNELAIHRGELTKENMEKALNELNNKYMVDFHKNTPSKEVEKKKYEFKEKAEAAEGEQLDKAYLALALKHQECIANGEEEEKFLFFWMALIEFQLFND